MIRIALFGQMENGKTTVAKMLQKYIFDSRTLQAYGMPILQFASPIYETFSQLTNLPVSFLKDHKNSKLTNTNLTIREGLQRLGKAMREYQDDIFINKLFYSPPTNYIIDDGRFERECIDNRKIGGKNILIVRPTHINYEVDDTEVWVGEQAREFMKTFDGTKLTHFDNVIYNSQDLLLLESRVIKVFNEMYSNLD